MTGDGPTAFKHLMTSKLLRFHLGSASEVPGLEPMDFAVWDARMVEEILHRFKPKAFILCTASCPSVMQPLLEAQIPTLAVCVLPDFFFASSGTRGDPSTKLIVLNGVL